MSTFILPDCLQCPKCKQSLQKFDSLWTCTNGHTFSEAEGVPVFRDITEEHPLNPIGGDEIFDCENVMVQLRGGGGFVGWLRRLIGTSFVPYPTNQEQFYSQDGNILNIGSGPSAPLTPKTVNLDLFQFPSVSVVADSCNLPYKDESFDYIVIEACLEHIKDPQQTCREASRVLKQGGRIFATWPFMCNAHGLPYDYFRYTPSGMDELFSGLRRIDGGVRTGTACRWIGATADLFQSAASIFTSSQKISFIIRAIVLTCLFPIKYLDYFFVRQDRAWVNAVELYGVWEK